jgi:OOP family OmpA-OmpF porin
MSRRFPTLSHVMWVACAAALALACAGKPLPDQEPFALAPVRFSAGQWRTVDNIVIVTDASGSTYEDRTLQRSKALTRSFIASLPDPDELARDRRNYNAGFVAFGGDARVVVPIGPFERGELERAASGIQAMGSLDGRGGTTPLAQVFDEVAAGLEGRHGTTALVIFSDGQADDPDGALDRAQALIASHSGPICVHTVQVGSDATGARLLGTLSELSSPCGSFSAQDSLAGASGVTAYTVGVLAGNVPPPALPAVAAAAFCGQNLRNVYFSFDQEEIRPGSAGAIELAVDQLLVCPGMRLRVEGFTDSSGEATYNDGLSERRAEAVRDFLVGAGTDPSRIEIRGRGPSSPAATKDSRVGRAANRRVVIEPAR